MVSGSVATFLATDSTSPSAFFRFTPKFEPDFEASNTEAQIPLTEEVVPVVGHLDEDTNEINENVSDPQNSADSSGVVVIESGGTAPAIAAGEGLLVIDGDLADEIFVDGVARGSPPVQLGLEPGQYLIKAEKKGFKTVWKWAGLTLGEKTEIEILFD